MYRSLRIVMFLIILVGSLGHVGLAAAEIGHIPGAADVSQNGAFNYRIPLSVPPGPGRIQPQMSLAYDSQDGNGTLGVGWSLDGLSAIVRCRHTIAQDNGNAPISLTYDDVFCLNGQRLRLTSGTYGHPGSTYETEIANFAKITAYGSSGNGPSYFTVEGHDGRIYQYGNGDNSLVFAQSSVTASAWMLNRVSDRAGNSMQITYRAANQTESLQGATVPETIRWAPTGHGASTYRYSMQFNYQVNATPLSAGYVAGTQVRNHYLLKSILVQSSQSTIRNYVLTYSPSPTTVRQTLTSLQECADAAAADCLTATSFTYQSGQAGFDTNARTLVTGYDHQQYGTAHDLNGDGRNDIYWVGRPNQRLWVAFAKSDGTGYLPPFDTGITNVSSAMAGNLDGSGTDGLLRFQPEGGAIWYWYYKWNGASFVGQRTTLSSPRSGDYIRMLADLNGDGRDDAVWVSTHDSDHRSYYHVSLNTSANSVLSFSQQFETIATKGTWAGHVTPQHRKVDVWGDGRANIVESELVYINGTPVLTNIWVNRFNDTTHTFDQSLLAVVDPTSEGPVDFVDFNDDGCMDALFRKFIALSVCNTSPAKIVYIPPFDVNAPPGRDVALAAIDWNNDGRKDVLLRYNDMLYAYIFRGVDLGELIATGIAAAADGEYLYRNIPNATGDGADALLVALDRTSPAPTSVTMQIYLHRAVNLAPDLLTSVTDGYGVRHSPQYTSLANGNYTKGSTAVYPNLDWVGPLYVVSQLSASDGIGGTYTRSYAYADANENRWGRPFGIASMTVSDSRPNAPVRKIVRQTEFPFLGMLAEDHIYQSNGVTPISTTTYANSAITLNNPTVSLRYFPFAASISIDSYEVGGSKNGWLVKSSLETFGYDSYGNLAEYTSQVTDRDNAYPPSPTYNHTWTRAISNSFSPNLANWCLGIPTRTTVLQYATTAEPITRTTSLTPDYVNCRVTQKVVEPNSSAFKLTTDYGYDSFGNINSITIAAAGVPGSRTTTINWGITGQFPESVTDALGSTTVAGYDYDLGVQTAETDPNGITTTWGYDRFARKTRETRPDNTSTTYTYESCSSVPGGCQNGDPASAATGINKLVVTTAERKTNGEVIRQGRTYLDQFGRNIVSSSQSLDGTYSRVGSQYDVFGRLRRQTVPCNSTSCTPHWSTYTYDALHRLTLHSRPVSESDATLRNVTVDYQGLTTMVTDPLGKQKIKSVDPNGWLRRSQDHNGYYQTFEYDAFGSVLTVTDGLGNNLFSATYAYGATPLQVSTADMDRGAWQYGYNAFGEQTSWRDPNGNRFQVAYDKLSRPVERRRVDSPDEITYWKWGNSAAGHNIDKLSELTRWQWIQADGNFEESYTERFSYDSAGRLVRRTLANTDDCTDCSYDWQYDGATGLLDTLVYPSSTTSYRLRLKHTYQYGLLQSLRAVSESPQLLIWQAGSVNPRGQITRTTLGNGIVMDRDFDAVAGWLSAVHAGRGGGAALQNQSYLYDAVGNVTQRQNNNLGLTENFYYDNLHRLDYSTLNNQTNLNLSYDAMGNVTSRSDVANGAIWSYDPARKHAVTRAGSNTYAYDSSGNMINRNGQQVVWSALHQVQRIADHSYWYTPDGRRLRQYANGVNVQYVGELFEHVLNGLGPAIQHDYRHYVYAGAELVAIYSRRSDGNNAWRYLISDHQASIASITDTNGATLVEESFGAFGERRDAAQWSGPPPQTTLGVMEGITQRGYTAHEMLSSGLIHMSGRVQDAVIGRFLSPDPYVADAGNTQGYNRYSYAYNNPLTYVDPNGFQSIVIDWMYMDPDGVWCCGYLDWSGISQVTVTGYNLNVRVNGTVVNPSNVSASGNSRITIATGGGSGTNYRGSCSSPFCGAAGPRPYGSRYVSSSSSEFTSPVVSPPTPPPPTPAAPTREQIEAVTGTATAIFDAAALRLGEGSGMWRGKNGKYYNESWGGNGATGARKLALADRAILGGTGKLLGWVGVGQNIVDVGVDIATESDQLGSHSVALGIGLYGMFGGVPGAIFSGAYSIGKATGLNDAIYQSRLPLFADQADPIGKYGSVLDCMCGL